MQKELTNWKNKEGLLDETVWQAQGIQIYRKLLEANPSNTEYKVELANLLIKSGTDEKLEYMNLQKAERLFEEVLQIIPDHVEALYRLGHINYEINQYQRSVDYFEKINNQQLSNTKLIRTYLTLAKAYYHFADDGKAYKYFEQAKELDKENDFSSEIKEAKALITEKGEFRIIVHYPDGSSELMTQYSAEELDDDVDSNIGTLNLAEYRATFSGPANAVELERREAEIFRYIIDRKTYVTKEDIIRKVWETEGNSANPNTVKSYISTINKKIKKCLEVEENPIVSKRGQGYIWNSIDVIVKTRVE